MVEHISAVKSWNQTVYKFKACHHDKPFFYDEKDIQAKNALQENTSRYTFASEYLSEN